MHGMRQQLPNTGNNRRAVKSSETIHLKIPFLTRSNRDGPYYVGCVLAPVSDRLEGVKELIEEYE
jgi:hypothetical protein